MNAVSMNNLWTYLQGLSLTAENWQWLAERAKEKSNPSTQVTSKPKEVNLKSASNLNGNLNCSKELEHYAS